MTAQAVVLLRILRHNMKSTLPVQLVWAEASEMTPDMFSALQEAFGPLYGTDASNVAPAEHHMPGNGVVVARYYSI